MLQHNHENDKNSFFRICPTKIFIMKKANEGGVILFKSAMKKLWKKNKKSKRKKRRGREKVRREKVRRDKVRKRRKKKKYKEK